MEFARNANRVYEFVFFVSNGKVFSTKCDKFLHTLFQAALSHALDASLAASLLTSTTMTNE